MSKMPAGTTLYPRKQRVRNAMVPHGRAIMPKHVHTEVLIDPDVTLAYRFTDGTLAPVVGSAALTVTRNSIATYFDSNRVLQTAAINEPRFGHDPADATPLGLLIEEARTNLVFPSTGFDTLWTVGSQAVLTPNAAISPSGLNDASLLSDDNVASSGTNVNVGKNNVSLALSTNHVFSVFLKKQQSDWSRVDFINMGTIDVKAYFNLSNGTIGGVLGANNVAQGIEEIGLGWFRCWVSFVSDAVDATGSARISPAEGDGVDVIVRDGTATLFVWGAQVEAGAFPTSYIPTAGAAVTRELERCLTTDMAFYNLSAGSVYVKAIANYVDTGAVPEFMYAEMASTSNDYLRLDCVTSSIRTGAAGFALRRAAGAAGEVLSDNGNAIAPGSVVKIAGAFSESLDDRAIAVNGQVNQLALGAIQGPTPTQLLIGSRFNATVGVINGHVAEFAYAPVRKANEFLQDITLNTVLL